MQLLLYACSFLAETFWSLRYFSHMTQSSINATQQYSLVYTFKPCDLIFSGHLKKFGL